MSNTAHGSTAGAAVVVVTPSVGAGLGIDSTLASDGALSAGVLSGVVVRGTVERGGREVAGGGVVVEGRAGGTAPGAWRSADHAARVATATSTAPARRRLQTTHP